MIALTRFLVTGYVRSTRAVYPVLALFLLLGIMFTAPIGEHPQQGVLNLFADLAVMLFPICAWAARGLLDTEPDAQRHLSAVAAGRSAIPAGLVACVSVNLCLVAVAVPVPIMFGLQNGVGAGLMSLGVSLNVLSALAATFFGALTSRAIIQSSGTSLLVLLGGSGLILLLSIGPLRVVSMPMVEWMRAANNGSAAFRHAFPGLVARILAWSLVVGGLYVGLRRVRP